MFFLGNLDSGRSSRGAGSRIHTLQSPKLCFVSLLIFSYGKSRMLSGIYLLVFLSEMDGGGVCGDVTGV